MKVLNGEGVFGSSIGRRDFIMNSETLGAFNEETRGAERGLITEANEVGSPHCLVQLERRRI